MLRLELTQARTRRRSACALFLRLAVAGAGFCGDILSLTITDADANVPQPGYTTTGTLNQTALLSYQDWSHGATFRLTGSPIVGSSSVTGTLAGEFWRTFFTVDLTDGDPNDLVSITGTLQHVIAPHPEGGQTAPGPLIPFGIEYSSFFAYRQPGGLNGFGRLLGRAPHGHMEDFGGITISIRADRDTRNTQWWRIAFYAAEIPEPSTWALTVFGSVLLIVGRKVAERRSAR